MWKSGTLRRSISFFLTVIRDGSVFSGRSEEVTKGRELGGAVGQLDVGTAQGLQKAPRSDPEGQTPPISRCSGLRLAFTMACISHSVGMMAIACGPPRPSVSLPQTLHSFTCDCLYSVFFFLKE